MMASDDGSPVRFYGSCRDAFYFDVGETVVDGDSFTDSGDSFMYYLRCKDNKILLLNTAGQFRLKHLSKHDLSRHECKFTIHTYRDISQKAEQGVPVMLYANLKDKKMVACCRDNNEIYPEEMVIPNTIQDTKHKALFYLTQLSTGKFMFESSVYRSKFLGFTCVGDNSSLKKLVLRSKGPDGVDESSEATLHKCN